MVMVAQLQRVMFMQGVNRLHGFECIVKKLFFLQAVRLVQHLGPQFESHWGH